MRELSKGETLTYAIDTSADVTAREIAFENFGNTRFVLNTPSGSARVEYPLNGRHNILNALAASAVGHIFGMNAEEIASSLGTVEAPPQRGEILKFVKGFTVINDSYNSNPAALLSMVQTLVDGAAPAKRKIVVAGEMLELGDDAHTIHRQTGETIAAMGIDMLIGVRGLADDLVRGAETQGHPNVHFAADSDAAAEILADEIREGDVVLVKGSRGVRTEKVVEKLLKEFELEEKAL
jgi:UDP-N-acetylmuramoyl-tripeptide--D-alanyl-D-alanine ligase